VIPVDEVVPLAPFETISWQIGDLVHIPDYQQLLKYPFRNEKIMVSEVFDKEKQEKFIDLIKEQQSSLLADDELSAQVQKLEVTPSSTTLTTTTTTTTATPQTMSNENPPVSVENSKKELESSSVASQLLHRYANVYCTKTMLDIQWQDGTLSKGISSTDLVPMQTIMNEDFWPGDFIISKKKEDKKTGIVATFDHKDKIAHVIWFADHGKSEITEEDVPIFNFLNHEGYAYTLGDIVIKLDNENINPQQPTTTTTAEKKKKSSKKDKKEVMKNLDWVGYVVGIGGMQVTQTIAGKTLVISNPPKSNELTVIWVNGTISNTCYDQILKLEFEDEEEEEYDEDDDQYQYDNLEDGQSEPGLAEGGPGEMPSVFSQPFEKTSWWFETEEGSREVKANLKHFVSPQKSSVNNNTQKEEISEETDISPIVQVPTEYSKEIFVSFEALTAKPTHHKFYTGSHEVAPAIEFYTDIVKEWAILQKNLPFGIFVKAYEEEIQCLSVMIIGPHDTP
jgi:ubiquitin-conjugating enzyme E2 O